MTDRAPVLSYDPAAHLFVAEAARRLVVSFWACERFSERDAWVVLVDLCVSLQTSQKVLSLLTSTGYLQFNEQGYTINQAKRAVQMIAMDEGLVLSRNFAEVFVARATTYRGIANRIMRILQSEANPVEVWSHLTFSGWKQICQALGVSSRLVCRWHIERVLESLANTYPTALRVQVEAKAVQYGCVGNHPAYREPPVFIPLDDNPELARVASTVADKVLEYALLLGEAPDVTAELLRSASQRLLETTK